MTELRSFQKKYLRGLAHSMKPVVQIGQRGLTKAVLQSVDAALDTHELIKVKFIECKEKELKKEITDQIETRMNCALTGMIGHIAIFYRQQSDPERRQITLPER
ncbi:RNA-binding protein [Desulfonema ishimotonii]|uniref:RNA-binding protein n=1 Tax=Desulfonema ishimotonii TaxID=45657 RepID=A0A401FTV9_9BACT|nr:YhbY family RNA-binding protein [Desulfonema ishimotonii]GBC60390.1 RNA-binding protein [Desulfonema ishimotonii]